MKVQSSIQINAPIEEVFRIFTDIENLEKNIENIIKVELLSDKKEGLGVKWRETRVFFGREATEEMEISDLKENESYTVTAESNGTKYTSVYNFQENNGGTLVEMEFSAKTLTTFSKIMSIFAFLFIGSIKKAFQKDMEELKRILEKQK